MQQIRSDRVYWRINDFSSAYGIGRTKIYELINSGKLETVKFCGRTLITNKSVEGLQSRLDKGEVVL